MALIYCLLFRVSYCEKFDNLCSSFGLVIVFDFDLFQFNFQDYFSALINKFGFSWDFDARSKMFYMKKTAVFVSMSRYSCFVNVHGQ